MLTDLSSIALEWAKNYVRQRQTFKLNTKGENMAPLAFQHDPDGTHHSLAVQLRNYELSSDSDPEDTAPAFEPIDGEETDLEETRTPSTKRDRIPTPTTAKISGPKDSRTLREKPEERAARKFSAQKEIMSAWIEDEDHDATEECRHALELYVQLNDSEFSYVTDLQIIYDEARCFFLQWVLGKETKKLVNSARISAVQLGQKFTWVNAKAETLRTLTDVTLTARFLAVARLRRQPGTAAKLWISQILTRKALLEDSKLGTPIILPESLYLEILVGQMSAQETTVFDNCPSIGDDLLEKDWTGKNRYTLDKLKKAIDACSNPPYFRGVKTPITDLLDLADSKPAKEKRDQTVKKEYPKKTPAKTPDKSVDRAHLSRRPDHEQPAKFPHGLKRPDLTATVDGNKIASEAQRQLFDDVKRGNCSRCHKGGHNCKDCKEPKAKWEDKFDKEQSQYWTSVLKWQQRAGEQSGTVKDTKPPTLHVKFEKKDTLEKRFAALAYDPYEDEYEPLVHYHTTMSDPDDTPETDDTRPIHGDGDVNMARDHLPPRMAAPTPRNWRPFSRM
jgi:hypothetical protein